MTSSKPDPESRRREELEALKRESQAHLDMIEEALRRSRARQTGVTAPEDAGGGGSSAAADPTIEKTGDDAGKPNGGR